MPQTIALHVVRSAFDDWSNQRVEICRIHLVVAGHDDQHVGA